MACRGKDLYVWPLAVHRQVFRNAPAMCTGKGDKHLKATLRLVSSDEFKPNIENLVDAKRCQLSCQK